MTKLTKSWSVVALIVTISLEHSAKARTFTGREHATHPASPEEASAERIEKLMSTTNHRLLVPSAGTSIHPLDPLSSSEIRLVALIVRMYDRSLELDFEYIGLHEPEKALLISSFLTDKPPTPGTIERKAGVLAVDHTSQTPYWIVVNLSTHKVESFIEAREDQISPYNTDHYQEIARKVLFSDKGVLRKLKELGFKDLNSIIPEVWETGFVADNPNYSDATKLVQVFMYAVHGYGDNIYAHPIGFVVHIDVGEEIVCGIENLPIHDNFDTQNTTGNGVGTDWHSFYPEMFPSVQEEARPISTSSPPGASFQVHDRQVIWQNFNFRVGYNPREGTVINLVSYNDMGTLRPLFYRLSTSEVFIQYGDSRPPYHRKSSFDMGNYGFGDSSHSLTQELCGGGAHYFDAVAHNAKAETRTIKNEICIVEEADGKQWAHHDWVFDRTFAKQSQRLAVKSHVGIGNANYLVSWRFYQDASIELSIRVTGLLSTNLAAIDVKSPSPLYGNMMASQVYSTNFQYFMGARIDADIDGVQNTVTMEELVPVSSRVDSRVNPYGNGMITKSTVLKTAEEGKTDYAPGRWWRISNPNRLNGLNGRPTSYKLSLLGPVVPSLLSSNSPLRDRITWANHNMWVLPQNDVQVFIDDLYLDSGVNNWVNENTTANIENTDVTLWPVFGFAHAPDLEDFPILTGMPEIGFQLRPSNFFTSNPLLRVPPVKETTKHENEAIKPSTGRWQKRASRSRR